LPSIISSVILYCLIIALIQYFAKDFLNKTNPTVIYQENEFSENFTIPLNTIFQSYYYDFYFDSEENIYNLASNETSKKIFNKTNEFFFFKLFIRNGETLLTLNIFPKVLIQVSKKLNNNGTFYFHHSLTSNNLSEEKLNITLVNMTDASNLFAKNDVSYNDINITIDQNTVVSFIVINKTYTQNIENFKPYLFEFYFLDNIINLNKNEDFKEYIDVKAGQLSEKFGSLQKIYINFGIVKFIDDTGIIFSEQNQIFKLKKNYDNFNSNLDSYSSSNCFRIEFSKLMKQYERKYKKLQNVFADLGGLLNSLIFIGKL